MRCERPGCTGTVTDGYCDVCGLPPVPSMPITSKVAGERRFVADASGRASAEPMQPLGAPVDASSLAGLRPSTGVVGAAPGKPTGPCPRPDCPGSIVDGFCDVCGTPEGFIPEPETPDRAEPTASLGRLATTALGSALVPGGEVRRPKRVTTTSSARLGGGLTSVPPQPEVDPLSKLMTNPVVPESRRFCPQCGKPIGRSIDGQPGRIKGFCPTCSAPYDFEPAIAPGTLVAGQYEVSGAIAYGGMGWIYLARDKNVSDRWVVLKGLLNAQDADARQVALSEREFLAQTEHPLVVEIYNFVTASDGGRYLVMEYVPGVSLNDLLKKRMVEAGGVHDPLPIEWALAYIIEVLPAFTYFHKRGLLFCDFKPDNVMQVGDSLKLIDLGGVRHEDDDETPLYGTVGFQAPELAARGASVASDVYTIGRTLLVLCTEFRGYTTEYASSLPPREFFPELADQEPFYRLVQRCCAPNPDDRFSSAEELRGQALCVLREIVGRHSPATAFAAPGSSVFDRPMATSDTLDWSLLPTVLPDPDDPMAAWVARLPAIAPEDRLAALTSAPQRTHEVDLTQARLLLDAGDLDAVGHLVADMLARDPWDWRALWIQGFAALARQDAGAAVAPFNAVDAQLPGELAPKLALALSCELIGDRAVAEEFYEVCAHTDASYVTPSAFGLARMRSARGDVDGALEALARIPSTNRGYNESMRQRAQLLTDNASDLPGLVRAMDACTDARLRPREHHRLAAEIISRALEVTADDEHPEVTLDGVPATTRALRKRLAEHLRAQASVELDRNERIRLIDRANSQRPWSVL